MSPRWHEITALFGGTFDPPHLAHREVIEGLFSFPGIKKVHVLLSPIPAYKTSVATLEQRLAMVRLNFSTLQNQDIQIDLREIERSIRYPNQPTYSYDTLIEMRQEIPNLAFVIGTDQLEKLDTWHRFPEVIKLCHWIVLLRKSTSTPKKAGEILRQWSASGLVKYITDQKWETQSLTTLQLIPTEARALSSTYIRETIGKTGSIPANTLLPEVESYLKLHRIYGIR